MQRRIVESFVIPAEHGGACLVKKGQVLRIHLVEGQQVGDCAFFNADDPKEQFHVGQSWALNVMLGTGNARATTPLITTAKSRKRLRVITSIVPARLARKWWAVTGSNRRPYRCKRYALPAELTAPRTVCPNYSRTVFKLLPDEYDCS